jgi:hypothetical protein
MVYITTPSWLEIFGIALFALVGVQMWGMVFGVDLLDWKQRPPKKLTPTRQIVAGVLIIACSTS